MLSRRVNFEKDEHDDEMGIDSLENIGGDLDTPPVNNLQDIDITSGNYQSIDELISWYLTSDQGDLSNERIIDANKSTTLANTIDFQKRLQNYIDKNRIVYADTGEEISNISIEDLTFVKNKIYFGERQILTLKTYIRNGIYVFAQTGQYVDLTRKEINEIPIINGKKIYQGQEIITENAYKLRRFVFATNGISLTAHQLTQIVEDGDGKKYVDGIEIVPRFSYFNRTLVFATDGTPLTETQKTQIVIGEDGKKYLNGIKIISKAFYERQKSLVFATDGTPLTEFQKTQIVIGEDGKKYLEGIKIIPKYKFRESTVFVFASNGTCLTEEQKKQITTDSHGKRNLAGARVITESTYKQKQNSLVFADTGKRLDASQSAQVKLGTEKLKLHLGERKVVTMNNYLRNNKFVFADNGKQLTDQETVNIKEDADGEKYLDKRKIISKGAYVELKKRNKRKNDLVYSDSCTFLSDSEKEQIEVVKGHKSYQGRRIVQYEYFMRQKFKFISGPNIGQELNREEKKRIKDGFCDGFAVKKDAKEGNKKRRASSALNEGRPKRSRQTETEYISISDDTIPEQPLAASAIADAETANEMILGNTEFDDIFTNFSHSISTLFPSSPQVPQPLNDETLEFSQTPDSSLNVDQLKRNKQQGIESISISDVDTPKQQLEVSSAVLRNSLFIPQGADNKLDANQRSANTSSTTEDELRNVYAGFSLGGSGFFTPPPSPHTLPVNDDPLVDIFSDYGPV